MSPEQIGTQRAGIDRRTDIYSLGVTLFLCLTLRRPFEAPTREGLYQAILHEEPPDPITLNSAIPPELRIVLACAMEKDADRRYATAEDFAEDLKRVRELRPIAARPVSRWLRARRWAQRNPVVATMSAAIFVFMTVGFVWTLAKNRELDEKNVDLATARRRADGNAADARSSLVDIERLSDTRVLRDLDFRAENELWPALPEKVRAMKEWVDEAEDLLTRSELHARNLKALRERAFPYDDDRRRKDWAVELARQVEIEDRLEKLDAELDRASRVNFDALDDEVDELDDELDGLRAKIKTRKSWSFESAKDAWLHEVLAEFVEDLRAFTAKDEGALSSVRGRLDFASNLRRRSVQEPAARWRETIDEVAKSDEYTSLHVNGLTPQMGLIPLGADPDSGLQEFLHLASHEGEFPERDERGRLSFGSSTGIILVLIPGGRFDMGSQAAHAKAANFDRFSGFSDGPVHPVTLSAFFLSKYEMTQAQWARARGGATPSHYSASALIWGNVAATLENPVESVAWTECGRTLARLDLMLPTEAQWEYAARAGSSSPWHTGSQASTLEGSVNIADSGSTQYFHRGWPHEPNFVDGYSIHAPVGHFAPNDFGLHDMHGNVSEWCRDFWTHNYDPMFTIRPGDGLRRGGSSGRVSGRRILRGGSFLVRAVGTRSAYRDGGPPNLRGSALGLRPARPYVQG